MNKIFKVVWNEARRAYVVVSEYAKAQGKGCSGKKLLAMLIAAGVLSCPMFNVAEAATLGAVSKENYVAIKIDNPYTAKAQVKYGGYTYKKTSATYTDKNNRTHTVYYYVRDGYTIKAEYNHLFTFEDVPVLAQEVTDYTISTYKTGASSTTDADLLKSNQVLVTASGVKTLTNVTINEAESGTFVGSSNSGGVKTEDSWNYIIYDSDGKYVDASKNMSTYFHTATLDSTTGQYTHNGEVIAPENLYVLTKTQTIKGQEVVTKTLGYFTTKDQELYKGSVFGLHNEVLMTTKDGDTLYSYWGAATDDPNETIGSMRVGQLNDMFTVVENNIKSAMGDDIEKVETTQTGDNSGTINLIRRGIYNTTTGQYAQKDTAGNYLPGVAVGLNVKSEGGTGGNGDDMRITISVPNGEANTDITLNAGSKVVAQADANKNLSGLKINGIDYTITGQTYTPGNNITIDNGVISAKDTKYTVTPGSVESGTNEVRAYDINESGNTNNPIAHIVDTDTRYTITSATGTGNVKTTYTITPNDGSDPTTIVDTDTNTTYAQGNGVTIIGDDNTIAVKTATNAGLIVDGDGVTVNVDDSLSKVDNVISVNKDRVTLSYKANGANGQTVSLANGLNFVNGTNTNATIAAGGVVTFDLKDNISLSSVTTGDVSMSADGLNAGSKVISNVANGSADNDAVNVSQLADAKTELNTSITNNYNTLNGNDIASIKTESTSTGGTINLIRNDNSSVDGGLTITSAGGTDGADKTITIAGMNGDTASAITLNAGSVVTGTDSNSDGYLDSLTINGTGLNIKQYSEGAGINITGTDNAISVDVGDGMQISGNAVAAKLGAGLGLDSAKAITVVAEPNKGITVSASGVGVQAANGILVDANGVGVKATDGIIVGTSGVGVKANEFAGITVDTNGVAAKVGSGLYIDTQNNNAIAVKLDSVALNYSTNEGTNTAINKTTNLDAGLNFVDGTNTTATITTDGSIQYNLNDNIQLTNAGSVTIGDVVMNASGLTTGTTIISDNGIAIGTNTSLTGTALTIGGNTYVTTSGLNANNQKITNVANGTEDSDAVNYGQLKSAISGGTSTNDIKSIQTKSDGTINLIRNDNSSVDGGLTITSAGGTDGADKTITIAGMNGDTASAITLNAGSVVTGTDSNSDGYLDSLTINGTGLNIKQYSEGAGINITGTDNAISVDVGDGMKIDGDKVAAKLGAGLGLDTAKAITVLAEQNKGISVSDNGIGVIANTNKGITVDASGVAVKIDNNSLTFDDNGYIKVNTALTSLKYRANGAAQPLSVSLDQGLDFKNGTNTTASVDVNGEVKYDLNKDVTLTDGSLIVTDADGAGNVVIQNGSITGPGYALRNDGSVSFANGSFSIASNGNITSSFGNGGHILADNNGFGVAQGGSVLAVTNDGVGLSKTNEDGVQSAVAVTDNGVGITSGASALVVGANGTVIKGGLDMMNEKITGVADGDISESSTDAVNGSQLKAVADAAAAANTKVEAGDNITVSTATSEEDGSKTYTVSLNKDVELEDGSLTVTGAAGDVLIQNGSITGPGYALRNNGSVSFANGKFDIGSDGSIKSAYSDNGRISADAQGFGVSKGDSVLAVTDAGVAAAKGDSALAVTDGGVGITSGKTTVVVSDSGMNVGGSKITGVANGEISDTSTDAVNGSQLNAVKDELKGDINNINNRIDGIDQSITNINTQIGDINNNIERIDNNIDQIEGDITKLDDRVTKVEEIAGKHTTVITDASEKNLTISEGTNSVGGKEYTITINRDMDLDSVTTGNTVMSNDGISFKDSDTKLTSGGLTVGNTVVDGDGISIKTEEGKETYITKDGINANDKKITNVADGDVSKDSTDAVNGSQLHATNEYISNVANQVADNSSRINKLGRRVDKVGAGSAALAALHPLDFDPDDKLTFSAGVGNYHGQNAAAIGAFYRPTEKIMVSVGGTVGNDENMVNAGISFALDRTNNVSNSRTAMAREIVDLRAQVANLTALVTKLISDKTGADPAAMFPDVPANHWAYEYINGLAMQGIIEGYPDGTFQGDATMTRYEFATMLFKAMEKGAVLSDRLREEFKNELGRIRVDRIKGADNDAGKIERVRVNEGADRDDYGTKLQAKG